MNSKSYILIGALVLAVVVGGALFALQKPSGPVACTEEAMICSDGSAVGRTGPNCEFEKCPDVIRPETTGDMVLVIGQSKNVGNISITLNTITQDSRCAIDVVCIWAGVVEADATLKSATRSENRKISSGEAPYNFDGHTISITSVLPTPVSTKRILPSEYRITFHVEKTDTGSVGTVIGAVTLSPVCPVERIPPDPNCAPKPYETKIEVLSADGNKVIKTIQSKADGSFITTLPYGNYTIQASGGNVYPSCSPVVVVIKPSKIATQADISCDTGIR